MITDWRHVTRDEDGKTIEEIPVANIYGKRILGSMEINPVVLIWDSDIAKQKNAQGQPTFDAKLIDEHFNVTIGEKVKHYFDIGQEYELPEK